MKANGAPEKLYFTSNENETHYYTEGIPFEREYVEYTRTDAFIDKACEFLDSQLVNDKDEVTGEPFVNFKNYGTIKETFISRFKDYMKR